MTKTEQQFIEAFDNYSDSIFRYCFFRLNNNRELAKDFVSETYMKAWKYMQQGNEVENLRALLYRIAGNLIIDHVRKHKKRKEESIDAVAPTELAEHRTKRNIEAKIDLQFLMDVAEQMDDYYYQVFMMRYVDGYSPKEIAVMLEKSPNTISVAITRAKKQLLEKYYALESKEAREVDQSTPA